MIEENRFQTLSLETPERQALVVITDAVRRVVRESGVAEGLCVVFCPHTTAGLTINSALDPATALDLRHELDRIVPTRVDFIHTFDTPSDAAGHIKATLVGPQLTLIVHDRNLVLGSAQGVFLCEFDGPRRRHIHVKMVADAR
ncbi:MAG: secondary thiamine-phosphate synthase enzyme YjbQ [Thermomicrobia bacterium]|nr:secondary thiamine-phosphate synthase enzyme YjbQ [Thermomicrobia bacterium]